MRIEETFGVNNLLNKKQPVYQTENFQVFKPKVVSGYNDIPSYFSSPKYFELKYLVSKYDLSQSCLLNFGKLNFASNCRKSFVRDFGTIRSSSMQQLVLEEKSPFFDFELSKQINEMRKECRKENNYAISIKKRMKERKIGNCTDIALVTAEEINNSQSKYNAKFVYASILNDDLISNHVAVLVQDRQENADKLNAESLVLDNWLGGIFKYNDWVKIIKKLYNSNNVSTYVTDAKQ